MEDYIEIGSLFTETEPVKYPCPDCGEFNEAKFVDKKGYAYCLCSSCLRQYRTNNKVSINFRKFCSKVASRPNKSQLYYTSLEMKVKEILDKFGYREGIDYIHNVAIRNGRSVYYIDFYIPKENKVIECDGTVWHNMWGRKKSDRRKYNFLKQMGLEVIIITEKTKNLKEYLARRLEWSVM